MNTYIKYQPNVFFAKCSEKHEKGETILVTTQHGKENECIVFNLMSARDGVYFYSIVRADGFNVQEWAKKRAAKYESFAQSAEKKSDVYYQRSNKDSDFLRLGEPIKIGHHSEKRHRRIIEQAHTNMGKCVEFSDKAKEHESKAEYWASKADTINLSMPESLEYYQYQLEQAKAKHEGLKAGTIKREHSFSLTYAKKEVNELQKKFDLAKKMWG
jgi:hypothetical protein